MQITVQSGLLFLTVCLGYGLSDYTDDLARGKMYIFSAAAYSTSPLSCLGSVSDGIQLVSRVEVQCDQYVADTCSAFTAVSHNDEAIVVSFRGTRGFFQLLTEGFAIFDDMVPSPIGGFVNSYFYNAFNFLWTGGLEADFLELKKKHPGYKIWLTGHSLGGALATLCASKLVASNFTKADNIHLYTLGQPRVGYPDFADAFDALNFAEVYRIVHRYDMVPHVPGMQFYNYLHVKNEIWYNNDMEVGDEFIECDAQESSNCSDGTWLPLSIVDHTHYFEHFISGYGAAGCIGDDFKHFFADLKEDDFKNVPHDLPFY